MANLRIRPAIEKANLAIKRIANQAGYTGMRNVRDKAIVGYELREIILTSAMLFDELRGIRQEDARYSLGNYIAAWFARG